MWLAVCAHIYTVLYSGDMVLFYVSSVARKLVFGVYDKV